MTESWSEETNATKISVAVWSSKECFFCFQIPRLYLKMMSNLILSEILIVDKGMGGPLIVFFSWLVHYNTYLGKYTIYISYQVWIGIHIQLVTGEVQSWNSSWAGRNCYGTENEIWAGFWPVGNTEKKNRKEFLKFSFAPKNERKYFLFLSWSLKRGQIKK